MGVFPNEVLDVIIIKHKNDMHAPVALQKLYRLFGF